MKEREEFCDMFTFVSRFFNVKSFMINVIRRFFKKFAIQFNNNVDTRLFFILCNNFVWITQLNASRSFKLNNVATFFLLSFYIMCTFSMINCNAIFINLCFLTFICVLKKVSYFFIAYRIHFDTIDFNIFFNVFNKIIDLNDANVL